MKIAKKLKQKLYLMIFQITGDKFNNVLVESNLNFTIPFFSKSIFKHAY